MFPSWLTVAPEVATARLAGRPVVALESTLIAHGLPWPANLETAHQAEDAIRGAGAVPATIAVWHGVPTVGLSPEQIDELSQAKDAFKASRRDLGAAVALKRLAATTVSATMALANAAGIRVFATGGIGGAHRGEEAFDISADLTELARTPVLVVCAGAKSILHLPRTLEILETYGVPVFGYRTDEFPEFYVSGMASGGRQPSDSQGNRGTDVPRSPGPLRVSARVESACEAASGFEAHVRMGGHGALLVQPCPEDVAVPREMFDEALRIAEAESQREGICGPAVTPFLLKRLAELADGKTLAANRALIVANARLAAEVAVELGQRNERGS